jgi:hypothetical protein
MLTPRLRARCPSATPVGVGTVRGLALRWHKISSDGSGKGNLAPGGEGDLAFGVLFEMENSHRATLDVAEGLGSGYDATEIEVASGDGHIRCLTYFATDIEERLQPYDWYRKLVLAGALEHGLPEPYVEKIETVTTKVDPNPRRRTRLEAERLLAEFRQRHPEHTHRLTGDHDGQALA